MRHTESKSERVSEHQRHRQREKQAPCKEPNVGLDPRTLGLCPELKAGAQPLSHPGVPEKDCFKCNLYSDLNKENVCLHLGKYCVIVPLPAAKT